MILMITYRAWILKCVVLLFEDVQFVIPSEEYFFLIYSVVSTFTTNLCVARELVKTKIFHLRIIYVLHENSKNRIPKRTKFSQKMVLSTKI